MDFFKKFEVTPLNILKAAGVLIIALVVITFLFRLFEPLVQTTLTQATRGGVGLAGKVAPGMMQGEGYYEESYARDMADSAYGYGGGNDGLMLSSTNIGIPSPRPGYTTGDDAEEFEVTEYSATIEVRDSARACADLSALKARSYVIFEHANEYDRGCNVTFKVAHDNVAEILGIIEDMDPEDLSESTYTIKQQIDDYTSETEILERKLETIDETLESAVAAYDELTVLATRTQDVESLAKIIDSKIGIIERLTQERITISAQLERLERSKAEQLDRLEYTYFHVNVYENKLIDGEQLANSWEQAVKSFVRDMNGIVQDVTINLVALLFVIAQYVLYFFILLFVAKYLWRAGRYLWEK